MIGERLSVPSLQALVRARDESERQGRGLALHSGHLLVGLAGRPGDQAERALSAMGVSEGQLRSSLEERSPGDLERGRLGHFSKDLVAVLRAAVARRRDPDDVTTGHLLLGVLDVQASAGLWLIRESGLDVARLEEAVVGALAEPDPPWVPATPAFWAVTVEGDGTPSNQRWTPARDED